MDCPTCSTPVEPGQPACPRCGASLCDAVLPGSLATGREPSFARDNDRPFLVMAGKWRRWWAYLIDYVAVVVNAIVVYTVLVLAGVVPEAESEGGDPWVVLLLLVLAWVYFAAFESTIGATPGKLALRIRVLTDHGRRLGFGRASARFAARFIPFDALVLLFSDRSQALHDMACGTIVVPASEVPEGALPR